MNTARRHLRFATWLALLAIAALALLPTLTHALARSAGVGGNGFAEVCTPQGMKLVALADGETAPSSAALHLEHCAYCTSACAVVDLPPASLTLALPAVAGLTLLPPLFLHAPRTPHAWASANPRAPPAHA